MDRRSLPNLARDEDLPTNILTHDKPILLLINPHSGQGKSVEIFKKRIEPFLRSQQILHEVFITKSDLRISEFIKNKDLDELFSFRSIVVVSGDGLLHETLNALMSRNDWRQAITIPIGIVPTGSGNGLAYTLIRRNYPLLKDSDDVIRICLEQAITGKTTQADLVKVTYGECSAVWSFLSIGWGLMADIDIDSEWLRQLGELRFTFYGLLRSVTSVSYRGEISYRVHRSSDLVSGNNTQERGGNILSDQNQVSSLNSEKQSDLVTIEDKFACVYAVSQSYISSVTKFSPTSTLTDELIYLTYVRGKLSPCKVIEFLLAIKDGSHDKLPYVTVVPVTSFTLRPLEASKVVVDGEVIPWTVEEGQILAEVVPKTLKLSWQP